MRVIDADELRSVLPMAAAIDALEEGFSAGLPAAPPRSFVTAGEGDLGVMPASGKQGAGVKVVAINGANPARGLPLIHGVYVLFSPETLETVGVIEGAALTAIRTAAVSGLATRYLARGDARRLVLFGAGTQARSHLEAMRSVRGLERVTVVSRTRERAATLVEAARAMGLEAALGDRNAVADADIVCTCTTSAAPVFDGSVLAEGAHVNAVGAYRPDARELDDDVMRRAATIVVEARDAALEEAGDVVLALQSRAIEDDELVELSDVVRARRSRGPGAVTVFKSVGIAFEDLCVARAAFDRASDHEPEARERRPRA